MEHGFWSKWAAATETQLQVPAQQFDPEFMRKLVPKMETYTSYFGAEVRGMDRVPQSPVLLIGNHSGGIITPDTSVDNAQAALGDGCSVLPYPGGTYEVFRPWKDRNRITFKGRKGFVRLALQAVFPSCRSSAMADTKRPSS